MKHLRDGSVDETYVFLKSNYFNNVLIAFITLNMQTEKWDADRRALYPKEIGEHAFPVLKLTRRFSDIVVYNGGDNESINANEWFLNRVDVHGVG